jgi:hypothetical protein
MILQHTTYQIWRLVARRIRANRVQYSYLLLSYKYVMGTLWDATFAPSIQSQAPTRHQRGPTAVRPTVLSASTFTCSATVLYLRLRPTSTEVFLQVQAIRFSHAPVPGHTPKTKPESPSWLYPAADVYHPPPRAVYYSQRGPSQPTEPHMIESRGCSFFPSLFAPLSLVASPAALSHLAHRP